MLSEIDLRDWDYDKLRRGVSTIRSPYQTVAEIIDADNYLREFIEHIEIISKSGQRQVAALFKPPKGADV